MKTNELMLGDLVTFNGQQNEIDKQILKICLIREDNFAFVHIDNDQVLTAIEIDDEIVGIPFTPEILEKNGWLPTDEPMVEFFGVGKSNRRYQRIEYVHQLQHALRLCGIDKEITL